MSQQTGAALLGNGARTPETLPLGTVPDACDTFFQGEDGTIAVFDFDYEQMIAFQKELYWTCYLATFPASCPLGAMCCCPCFLDQNVEWDNRSRHVALTVDGIRFVQERRKRLCGLACSDLGRESKTVPYDKITDCDVREPAGTACCCCVQNVLSTVNVDTASSGTNKDGVPMHELSLSGLVHPLEFKKAVWAIKRGDRPRQANMPLQQLRGTGSASGVQVQMSAMSSAPRQESMNTEILKELSTINTEIRDELRKLNAHVANKDSASGLR